MCRPRAVEEDPLVHHVTLSVGDEVVRDPIVGCRVADYLLVALNRLALCLETRALRERPLEPNRPRRQHQANRITNHPSGDELSVDGERPHDLRLAADVDLDHLHGWCLEDGGDVRVGFNCRHWNGVAPRGAKHENRVTGEEDALNSEIANVQSALNHRLVAGDVDYD